MTLESTWVGIVGVGIAQLAMFAKILIQDKRKANDSHVRSVEKSQDRLYDELQEMRKEIKELQTKLDSLQLRYENCATQLSASLTRLELLEGFRDIVEDDNPTGATAAAMPPKNGSSS